MYLNKVWYWRTCKAIFNNRIWADCQGWQMTSSNVHSMYPITHLRTISLSSLISTSSTVWPKSHGYASFKAFKKNESLPTQVVGNSDKSISHCFQQNKIITYLVVTLPYQLPFSNHARIVANSFQLLSDSNLLWWQTYRNNRAAGVKGNLTLEMKHAAT